MALAFLQIKSTLNKVTESTCKLFPFGCLIIQYAFKEHGDERRKIPLSNIPYWQEHQHYQYSKNVLAGYKPS